MKRPLKSIRLEGLLIGGRPVFCATVLEATGSEALAEAQRAKEAGADCIELRLDKLRDSRDVAAIVPRLPIPAIAVCRKPAWDGFFRGPENARVALLLAALEAGVGGIDLDLITPPIFQAKVIAAARAGNRAVMISYENFRATPPASKLLATLKREQALGADIAKFAVRATSHRDLLTILGVTLQARASLRIPFVAIAMGPLGSASRPLGLILGAAMTYCAYARGKEGAPGQLTVAETRHIVEVLSAGSANSVASRAADK